jgi:hypothetical protein
MEYNNENCIRLACDVAEDMDFDDLVQFVIDTLYQNYIHNKDCFDESVESRQTNEG